MSQEIKISALEQIIKQKDEKIAALEAENEHMRLAYDGALVELAALKSSRAPEVGEVVLEGWMHEVELKQSRILYDWIRIYAKRENCLLEAIPVVISRRVER